MTKLTPIQVKLAEQLLLSIIRRESVIEYNELANRINPPIFWRQVGREIGEVSKLCIELGLPLISVKVVGKGRGTVGEGFFPLFKMTGRNADGKSEKELVSQELKAVRECTEWYKLEDYLGLDLNFSRPNIQTVSGVEKTDVTVGTVAINSSSAMEENLYDSEPSRIENSTVSVGEAIFPDEITDITEFIYAEGAKKQVIVNAYERNPAARQKCITIHGSICAVCGFDFGEFYGEGFQGKIHVHHIQPLYLIDGEYEVNPETDLIPVCPNCHLALHSKPNGVFRIDELKELIRKRIAKC